MMDVYNKFKKDLFLVLVVGLVLQIAYAKLPFFRDNSDGDARSGVRVHVDQLTGCEYLGGRNGGIIPRLDADGNHICLPR